jgi:hypothetical protein
MKNFYTILLFLFASVSILAQAPENMSYQAVLRDASNTLLTNQEVGMQIRILKARTAVYIETQTATTNINGLVSIVIGAGTSSDDFSAIDWSAGPYFIRTATDPSGGSSYSIIGTSQLMSVPFAMYAKTSGSATPGPQGAQGAQGTQGIQGATGASGADGVTGADGAAGTNGTNGTQGTQGATGTAGADGAAGTNGTDGTQGTQGTTGTAGAAGAAGADGVDGTDGLDGNTGAAGIDGTNGLDGASAYQLALTNGFTGTEAEWLSSIAGAPGEDTLNPMTEAGDIVFGGASGAVTVLAAGAAGQVLTMNADATALEWVEIEDIIDVDVPLEVAITNSALTNNQQPTIEGTTIAGATITVSIDDFSITVTQDGTTWSATPADGELVDLTQGTHIVKVVATGSAGSSATVTQNLEVNLSPPTVLINDNDDDEPNDAAATTSDVTPTITGVTDVAAGQIVTIIMTGSADSEPAVRTGNAVVQDDTSWSINPTLSNDVWTILAEVTDPAGNVGVFTQVLTVDVDAPAVAITSSVLTNNPLPIITGSTEAGATIAVSINGLLVTTTLDGNGWEAAPTVGLADGIHNVSVTGTDAAGNTVTASQVLTVDTTLPALTVVHVGVTNDLTPQITGTTEAGATIAVDIEGNGALFDVVLNGTAWSATPTGNLEEDDYQFTVTSTDLAGNSRTLTPNFTIDQTPPEVTLDGGSPHTTADATPIISGSSVGVEVGSKVTVELAGDSGSPILDLITEIGVDGVFEVTAGTIANGNYTVTVTVTDAAGNTDDANQSLTVHAVAPAVTYTEGSVASTNDSTPLISGNTSAVVGSAVTVTIGGQSLETTVQSDATWNVTVTNLENDDYVVDTQVTDLEGNVGTASQVLTVDTTAPVVTIDAVGVTNDPRPEITLTTEAGATITAVIVGVVVGVTQDSTDNDAWSATPDSDLVNGVYTITATATDGAGNVETYSMTFSIDTTAPDVLIDDNYDDEPNDAAARTNDVTPEITGVTNASAGQIVTVIFGLLDTAGQVIHTGVAQAVVQDHGAWNVIPILSEGVWSVEAAVTDEAGNVGKFTQVLTVDTTAPALTISSSDVTNDDTLTIIGTTEVGAAISVSINGLPVTTTLDVNGWEVTPTVGLADGIHNVAVSATDAAGNTATARQVLTVDTAAPLVTIVDVGVTNDPRPEITFRTSGAVATITAVIAVTDGVVVLTQDSTDNDAWSATPGTDLGEGVYTITVTATDGAGNEATDSMSFTVDRTPPPVSIVGGLTDSTNDVTPTIVGSAVSAAGETVKVTFDPSDTTDDVIRTAVVQGDGTWNVTPSLSAGVWTILAEVTDEAGNVGLSAQTLTVDLDAPAVAITSDALTDDETPTIIGTTEVGVAIAVSINGLPVTTALDGNGWEATPTVGLADGIHNVSVTAIDAAGNTATASQVLTVDTTAPVGTIDAVGVTNDPRPVITFTTEAVAGITAVITATGGEVVSSALTQDSTDNDAWSATPDSDLVNDVYTITVTATDGAGNVETYSMSFSIDTTAPDVLIDDNYDDEPNDAAARTNDVTPEITGVTNASAGQIVTVIFGLLDTAGQVIHTGVAQAVVQDHGAWNVIPIMSEGVWSVEAAVTDEAGNVGKFTQVLTVDLTAPALTVSSSDVTNDDTPTIIGTTEVGAAISVSINGLPVTTTLDGNGWSATSTVNLSDGTHNVFVTATDSVGNTATVSQTLTVDTSAP